MPTNPGGFAFGSRCPWSGRIKHESGRDFSGRDELKIVELQWDYLEQSGFQVSILGRGDEVVSRIQKEPADLILLDLMLPGNSGEEVCRKLRTFSNIPIIMVTAKTEEIDRLLGLELGADDYTVSYTHLTLPTTVIG